MLECDILQIIALLKTEFLNYLLLFGQRSILRLTERLNVGVNGFKMYYYYLYLNYKCFTLFRT